MKQEKSLKNQLTILVNSCDSYEDLWIPFFTLFKKYWSPCDLHIIFNTETKDFKFDGLDIECVHYPIDEPYGKRMLNALKHVKTKYVLPLLDDFFIRSPVNIQLINRILDWMKNDSKIVYFSCDINNEIYFDWKVEEYPGFKRLPPACNYTLTMQAAIWQTNKYKKFWMPNVSPWEWELICNLKTVNHPNYKYYCITNPKYSFIDYGYNPNGMGVFKGKWVSKDVIPLFERENIDIDLSIRGFYDPNAPKRELITPTPNSKFSPWNRIIKYLGVLEIPRYFAFFQYCRIRRWIKKPLNLDYFEYRKQKTQKRFLNKHRNN